MTKITEKTVGQWVVELMKDVWYNTNKEYYKVVMTRSTDCLYDARVYDDLASAKEFYNSLKLVRNIKSALYQG